MPVNKINMASAALLKIWEFLRNPLHSAFGFQALCLGFLVLLVTGFRPPQILSYGEQFGDDFLQERSEYYVLEPGFIQNNIGVKTAGLREVLVEDEEGNLIKKIQPRKRDSIITYIVKSGDNISKIAHKFDLKVSTVLWANDLTIKETLRVGQKLRVPQTDGIFYKVQKRDTLGEIAKAHQIGLDKILAYNNLKQHSKLKVGQDVFLPAAQRMFIPQKPPPTAGRPGSRYARVESIGFRLRRPTKGILTQGFRRGHYALDISNKRNTPIYAAADGVVVKSATGWNYGYGKYVIIDHGNGVETLYAHNNLLKINAGEQVKAGELIALMGNTGNVWGPTGIHLHFEVRIRGRKVNPANYF